MSKLDKLAKVGASVGTAVNLWDRISGWWRKRREAKLAARRLEQWVKASIAIHKTQFEDDARLLLKGASVCSEKDFCLRPSGHLGECGTVLSPVWKRP